MTAFMDERIEEIARAALSRHPAERAVFLDEMCRKDAKLRREVERVMARSAEQRAKSDDLPPTQWPTVPYPAVGAAISPGALCISSYRVLGVLGEGSMGVVYRAEQENPHRVVALKVLKAGGASAAAMARFEHEAQLLGRLQHPGIAQIFEAGAAETGYGKQPFFAMELVQGVSLNQYARDQQLTRRERLILLVKLCEAAHHAHQKGVIHRDLKPGNILVDEQGQPKILDFGIALATDSDLQVTKSPNALNQLAGTVPYMSLEQVRGDPRELDIRTDVYALGVIGFELLTGVMPFDLKDRTIADAVRIVGEHEPKRLGVVDKSLRGEVETIIDKALQKDKSRRYQSASDLAGDIRRHLSDQPILARPASALYQFRKFAKRNKVLVGSASIVLAVAFVATIAIFIGFRDAKRSARRANAATHFLVDMLTSVDPKQLGRDVTVREVLDQADAEIQQGALEYEPEVAAALHVAIGSTYRALGFLAQAEPHLTEAVAGCRSLLGDRDPQTLEAMLELASLREDQGRYDEAESIYLDTLAKQQAIFWGDPQDTIKSTVRLGAVHIRQGRYEEAATKLQQAVATARRALTEDSKVGCEALRQLGVLYRNMAEYDEAEALLSEARDESRRTLGDEHPTTLDATHSLAALYLDLGRLVEAETLYREVLDARRRVLGDRHSETLMSMNNLALVLKETDDLAEAEALYRQALAAQRATLGADHSDTLNTMNNLAILMKQHGNLQEAEALHASTLETRQRTLGHDHPATLISLNNLAALCQEQGKRKQAEALYRNALGELRRKLGNRHPNIAKLLVSLGSLLESDDRQAEAEPLYREALEIRRHALPGGHVEIAESLARLGRLLVREGDARTAEPLLRECLEIRRGAFGDGDWRTANTESILGECLAELRQFDEAETLLRHSYPILKHRWGNSGDLSQDARQRICDLYEAWDKPDVAERFRAMESSPEPPATPP